MIDRPKLRRRYLRARKSLLRPLVGRTRCGGGKPGEIPDRPSILCIRIDRVGDMALTTPLIEALKKRFPRGRLTILASVLNRQVIRHNPHVDDCLVVPPRKMGLDRLRFIRALRRQSYDIVVDPYLGYELASALFSVLPEAPVRIGYAGWGREVFYTTAILKKSQGGHFIDATIDAASPLEAYAADRSPKIYLTHSEKRWAESWLKENRVGSHAPIGIHPGAHYPTQMWPPEYYAALIECIRKRYDRLPVVLFAGPGDAKVLSNIAARISCTVFPCPTENLRRFLALVSRCRVLICNNSGPLHLAVAAGVPTLSTMGPTEKELWKPRGENHLVLRRDALPCIGCNSGYCLIRTHACMREIMPQMMMEALSVQLDRKWETS